ncbi:MAG: FHA domain-containing protein [Deltaproteobacteria bacterium]|nr:FHA domain-containing protein [Deltaproteobacteria bacterium]
MKPTLSILSGEKAGEKFVLEENKRYIFGRDQSADLCLPEKKISRRHASLYWDSKRGEIVLEDLSSLNGSYVNGQAIAKPQRLKNKDRIQIGSYLIQLEVTEDVSSDSSIFNLSQPSFFSSSVPRKTDPGFLTFEESSSGDRNRDSFSETGGRLISGKLQELPLADLLQMLSTTKKSGRLVVSKKKIGQVPKANSTTDENIASLYLRDGDLLYVDYKGLYNEEAFFAILNWVSGYFALFPYRDFDFQPVMEMPLEALLLEGFRRLDEARASNLELHSQDTFEVELDEPLDSLKPEELKIFQLAWKQKSMSNIWKNSPYEKQKTSDIVRGLLKSGFLKRDKKD